MIYAHTTDIDECSLGRDNCTHACRDTDGSYECGCPIGQKLAANNHTCEGMCFEVHGIMDVVYCSS